MITLPYSLKVVSNLLTYLYTDNLPLLVPEDMDHACNLLILSDELFIGRLKENSELALLSCMTLKNVCEMLVFAFTYNAEQLKNGCMEFICLNLEAMLESRSLEVLDDDILKCLTDFYYEYNPHMCYRDILPHPDAPSDEVVMAAANECKISFEIKAPTPKSQKKRAKPRKSTDSNSLNTTIDEVENDIPIVRCAPEREEPQYPPALSKVQHRLRAIQLAERRIAEEEVVVNDSRLSTSMEEEFPDLETGGKSPNKHDNFNFRQKFNRLSQKARKRIDSETAKEDPLGMLKDVRNINTSGLFPNCMV